MRVISTINIDNTEYAIVDPGSEGGFINGTFAKYLIVPISTVDKNLPDDIRVYDENT